MSAMETTHALSDSAVQCLMMVGILKDFPAMQALEDNLLTVNGPVDSHIRRCVKEVSSLHDDNIICLAVVCNDDAPPNTPTTTHTILLEAETSFHLCAFSAFSDTCASICKTSIAQLLLAMRRFIEDGAAFPVSSAELFRKLFGVQSSTIINVKCFLIKSKISFDEAILRWQYYLYNLP